MKALFIVNPVSGPKRKKLPQTWRDRIIGTPGVELVETTHAGHASELAKQAARAGCPRVVAIGGDGTVHEVGTALLHSKTALGVVPLGSGNGYARSMNIPLKVDQAIDHALTAEPEPMDTAKVNEIPFLGIAGWGFDALVAHRFAEAPGRGLVNYVRTSVEQFKGYKAAKFKITVNGDSFKQRAFAVVAANTSEYGNNAQISPHSVPNDGLLELVIIDPIKAVAMPDMTTRLFTGNLLGSKHVRVIQAKRFKVKTKKEMAHLDGEPVFLERKTEVSVVPGSLLVLAG